MRHVAGVTVVEPGCRKLRIAPQLGDLHFVEADYPTPQGLVHVRHERQADGSVKTEVIAPAGVTYEVIEEEAK